MVSHDEFACTLRRSVLILSVRFASSFVGGIDEADERGAAEEEDDRGQEEQRDRPVKEGAATAGGYITLHHQPCVFYSTAGGMSVWHACLIFIVLNIYCLLVLSHYLNKF